MGYAVNRLNQYTSVNSVSFTYDDNGNLTSDSTYTYEYDPENRLLVIKLSGNPVVSYGYDAFGRRMSKTVGAATTQYCYDGDQVVAVYDGGNLSRKFIYGPGIDEPIGMIVPGVTEDTKYFYHQDALGSVVALSKFNSGTGSAEVVEKYSYSAFGQTQILSPNNELRTMSLYGNSYMFTGREYETETGLYYYRARFYNPAIGRFLQTDPIGYYDSMNLYQYCGNNPIIYGDPSGLSGDIRLIEQIEVLFSVDPVDSAKVYQSAISGYAAGKVMADSIIADSSIPLSEKQRNAAHKSIRNAVQHAYGSASMYRNIIEEDASQALAIHEYPEYRSSDEDTIVDERNNKVGKTIGLGDGNIYQAVREAYYNGQLHTGYKIGDVAVYENLKPLPSYVRDLIKESQAITNELKNLVESFNNRLEGKTGSKG